MDLRLEDQPTLRQVDRDLGQREVPDPDVPFWFQQVPRSSRVEVG